MILEQIMQTEVATLRPFDTIKAAIDLMAKKRIRHLPIVDDHFQIVGIITDRDVRDASPSIFHSDEHSEDLLKSVQSIMKTNVITGHPLDFVEETAALFYEHKISCLPIESDQKLVGIVTETDLLHNLVQLTGANQPGSQIEIKVPNSTGMLCEVATLFRDKKVSIISVLVYPDKDERYRILVFRVRTMNPMGVISDLKSAGYEVLWPNLPGISS